MRCLLPTLLLLLAPYAALSAADEPPNFIIIFADDLGYGDLGCYGNTQIRTPRIDAMAQEGMRFTSIYAQPICGPSRAAIMTGCYPLRVAERGNVKRNHPALHEKEITIAEVLKQVDYATGCFGKWDLARHSQKDFLPELFPTKQGFDYFFGTPSSNDRFTDLYRNDELIQANAPMATLTQRYTDEVIDFVTRHKDGPFFVYLPHTMPHTKLAASKDFRGKSPRGLYGDVLEEIDHSTGRILDAVKELALQDNTYVIFTSDNGPWLIKNKNHQDGTLPTDHGGSAGVLRSGKVSTWEGGVRVPFIAWAPGKVPAGTVTNSRMEGVVFPPQLPESRSSSKRFAVSDQSGISGSAGTVCESMASTLDMLPTLAALAGVEPPSDRVIDGEDIQHLLAGDFAQANSDKYFAYYLLTNLQAVRQGPWKLHLARPAEPVWLQNFARNGHIHQRDDQGFPEPTLYNLETDIGETTNVAAEHPEIVKELTALAESIREDLGDHDHAGTNMRFFDPYEERPKVPKWSR